jgi:hypothetical protein
MWNCNLNLELARRIRKLYPDTVIVFGGPDFSTEEELQRRWLENNPQVDFYTQYEGEEAFTRLLEALLDAGGDLDAVKRSRPGNMVCLLDGERCAGICCPTSTPPPLRRLPRRAVRPLFRPAHAAAHHGSGLPVLLHLLRGRRALLEQGPPPRHGRPGPGAGLRAERVHPSHTLFLADLNFGMYKQDIEYCEKLAEIQKKRDWPWNIVVSTGKVNKQRIYDCSRLTNFAIPVNGAFQSTDPRVLGHIKRKNLGLPELKWTVDEMRRESSEAQSYSQLILALPGETIQSHLHSIGDVLQTGFDSMDIFQLMMLPSSVMSRREQRKEHGITTKHRGLARCFGEYEWVDGERFRVIEHEEICIQNNTMSFEDYLYCRVFALTVHVFYNDFVLTPWYSLFRSEVSPSSTSSPCCTSASRARSWPGCTRASSGRAGRSCGTTWTASGPPSTTTTSWRGCVPARSART